MVPLFIVKMMPFATARLSSESMVRFLTVALMLSVTGEGSPKPLSMHTLTVPLLGTKPVSHFEGVFQVPAPPSHEASQAPKAGV